jgi:hypothetical protein
MVLVNVGTSLLAALGFWLIVEARGNSTTSDAVVRTPRGAMGLLVAASMLAAIGGVRAWPDYTADLWLVACGPALMIVGALLVSRAARGSRLALVSTVVLCGIDLGIYGLSYAVYRQVESLDDYTAQASPGLSTHEARLALDLARPNAEGLRIGNQVLLAGFSRIDGYAGLEPARTLDYRDANALRLAGVRYVAAAAPVYDSSQFYRHDQNWLSVLNPLPRVRLVTKSRATDSAPSMLPSLDVTHEVMIEASDESVVAEHLCKGTAANSSEPRAEILIDRPGHLVVACQTEKGAILALTESFHRGWTVEGNAAATSPLRLNGDFLGCLVPAGRSMVSFQFAPESLRYGRLASLCGLSLLVVLIGAGLPRFCRPQGL